MNTHEILIAAKALIDTPDKWIQGRYATTAEGRAIGPQYENAVCFCSLGAIHRVSANVIEVYESVIALETVIRTSIKMDCGITAFNDTVSHAEVMAAFDRAIEETK